MSSTYINVCKHKRYRAQLVALSSFFNLAEGMWGYMEGMICKTYLCKFSQHMAHVFWYVWNTYGPVNTAMTLRQMVSCERDCVRCRHDLSTKWPCQQWPCVINQSYRRPQHTQFVRTSVLGQTGNINTVIDSQFRIVKLINEYWLCKKRRDRTHSQTQP